MSLRARDQAEQRPRRPKRAGSLFGLRRNLPKNAETTVAIATFAGVFALWCLLSYGGLASSVFLPSPTKVLAAFQRVLKDNVVWQDTWISNYRVLMGFLAAALISIPLGLLAGNLKFFEAMILPFVGFVRYMPVPAFIPLIMVYVGIGESAKIMLIFLGTAVQMIVMIADVTRQVPNDLLKVGMTLGASPGELFRRVIWPGSLPGIMEVLRVNLGWAWTYLIVAELVASNQGLGFRILKAQRFLQTDTIFLYIFIIGLLGLMFDLLFRYAERRMFAWNQEAL